MICILPCVKWIASGKLFSAQGAQLSALYDLEGWDGGWLGGRKAQKGEDICIHMADSHCCMVETNATL